jgi:hypothetical protein
MNSLYLEKKINKLFYGSAKSNKFFIGVAIENLPSQTIKHYEKHTDYDSDYDDDYDDFVRKYNNFLRDYKANVFQTRLSPSAFILAFIYLDRFSKNQNPNNCLFNFYLISIVIATKFLNDELGNERITNYEWSVSTNIKKKDLNALEKQFLEIIDWDLIVTKKEFEEKLKEVQKCKNSNCTHPQYNLLFSRVKQCPNCDVLIFKTTTSQKIDCPLCKTSFDWKF